MGDTLQEEDFPDEVQFGPHDIVLPEQRVTGAAAPPPIEGSWLDDVSQIIGMGGGDPRRGVEAAQSLGRRASAALSQAVEHPVDTLRAGVQGLTMGFGDELAGYQAEREEHPIASAIAGPFDLPATAIAHTLSPDTESDAYRAARDDFRREDATAQERSPQAYEPAEVAGALLPAVLTGGASTEAQAPGLLTRLGRASGLGALFGSVSGAGQSEGTGADLARDSAESGGIGALLGLGAEAIPALSTSAAGRAQTAREAADLARVASIGTGGSTISRQSPQIAEFARLPGGISGQAERLRRLGLAPLLASPQGILERAQRAEERALTEGAMGTTRRELAERGAEVPTQSLVDALERAAREQERLATTAPYAAPARALGERLATTHGEVVPYDTARQELTAMSGEVPWTSERLSADAARARRGALRDALDDFVESQLGPEARAAYREGRLDYQTARTAREQAEDRAGRMAGHRAIGLTDMLAMAGASSPAGALGRLVLNRGVSQFGPTARASLAEALASVLGLAPRAGSPITTEALASQASPEALRALREALAPRPVQTAAPEDDPFADLVATDEADPFADLIAEEPTP